jgi:hypothetical protein
MAAMANVLSKDDATAPVEYTFVPITDTPNPVYRTNIAGVPLEGQMRAEFKETRTPDQGYKRQIHVVVPVMETLGASGSSAGYVAPPKVAYSEEFFFTQISNRRSTIADRANSLKIASGFIQGASATTATGTLDNASAGDAWKGSAHPGPQFFIQAVVPN